MPHALDSRLLQRTPRSIAAAAGERADVRCEMNRRCADRCRESRQLALGRAAANHQARAEPSKALVEVAEALPQELRPGPRRVSPVQQAVVEAEDRDHPVAGVERSAEGRVVANAKVTTEPDDLCHRLQTACVTRPLRSALSALR
jgi:hypothetical protein